MSEDVKKELSISEIVELVKGQLQGVKYFGLGVKGDKLRVIINELSAYEFMPVSVFVYDNEYEVVVIEELKIKDLDNNSHKESFYLRKNSYLEAKGKEKEDFVLEVKSKKKGAAMVTSKVDLLSALR